jgi:putative tricarboxylic transport membrane protein
MLKRRSCLVALGAAGLSVASLPSKAQAQRTLGAPRQHAQLFPKLKIFIPAGAGGGWDQTGRHLGAALQAAGLVGNVSYENKGGKGGTLGLAEFTQRHAQDPACLFVGGLVMLGALAIERSEALKQLAPVARLTSDYLVVCVAQDDRVLGSLKDLNRLLERQVDSITFTGGSAGGVDHMLAAMLLRSLKLDPRQLRYLPTSSGKEAVSLLSSGKAHVAISGYSEFKASLENKTLRPLAMSSRRALFGIPSLREQGVDTELANWRAVFAANGISVEQKDALRRVVSAAVESNGWRQSLLENNWVGSPLYGSELDNFIQFETGIATAVTHLLKLKG